MPNLRDFQYLYHKRGDHDVIYEISDQDIGVTTSGVNYYGYLNNTGGWIIQKWDTAANSFRYAIGNADYVTNWGLIGSLSYGYYSALLP